MATDNPKVQGYVPQAVYDRLNEFKDHHGLKSLSQAVTVALESFFELSNSPVNQNKSNSRLEAIEEKSQA